MLKKCYEHSQSSGPCTSPTVEARKKAGKTGMFRVLSIPFVSRMGAVSCTVSMNARCIAVLGKKAMVLMLVT